MRSTRHSPVLNNGSEKEPLRLARNVSRFAMREHLKPRSHLTRPGMVWAEFVVLSWMCPRRFFTPTATALEFAAKWAERHLLIKVVSRPRTPPQRHIRMR